MANNRISDLDHLGSFSISDTGLLMVARPEVKNESIKLSTIATGIVEESRLATLKHTVNITGDQTVSGQKTFADIVTFQSRVDIHEIRDITETGDISGYNFYGETGFFKKIGAIDSDGLYIVDDADNGIFVEDGGNVGIGTNDPLHKLHIAGDTLLSGYLYDSTNSTGLMGHVLTNAPGGTEWKYIEDALDAVGGEGTANYIPKWSDSNTLIDSIIKEGVITNGFTAIGFNVDPSYPFHVTTTGNYPGGNIKFENTTTDLNISLEAGTSNNLFKFQIEGGASADKFHIRSDSTTRFTILDNGNVGINSNSPGYNLEINDPNSSDASLRVLTTSSTKEAYARFDNSTSHVFIGQDDSNGGTLISDSLPYAAAVSQYGNYPLQLGTSNLARMTILSGGNVGIGTADPQAKLHVSGGNAYVDGSLHIRADQATQYFQKADGTNLGYLLMRDNDRNVISWEGSQSLGFWSSSTPRMTIEAAGDVGIGTENPLSKLHVAGDTILSGKVGIAIISPSAVLDVRPQASEIANIFSVRNQDPDDNNNIALKFRSLSNGDGRLTLSASGQNERIGLWAHTGDGGQSYINAGNVGIGTADPLRKLHVVGDIEISGTIYQSGSVFEGGGGGSDSTTKSFTTSLTAGSSTYDISFPSAFDSAPTLAVALQNDAGGVILPFITSGVTTSQYSIDFGATVPDNNYTVHTTARVESLSSTTQAFTTSLTEGSSTYAISFPSSFSSAPTVITTLQGTGNIVPYLISGVSTTSYSVLFGAALAFPGYKIHTHAVE